MDTTRLTPRQREVLDLLTKRRSNQQIADALGISLEGAKWHVREILESTGARSRDEAAGLWRVENGLPRRLWRMTWGVGGFGAAAAGVAVMAILAFALLPGGTDNEPQVAPESTATGTPTTIVATTATLASTATAPAKPPAPPSPPVLMAPSRTTRNTFLDYVTARLESNTALEFADLSGFSLPCSTEEYTTWPACPQGTAPPTSVLSIITFQCEIGWNPLTPDLRITFPEDRLTLYAVVRGGLAYTRGPAAEAAPDYWMFFTNAASSLPPGLAVAIKDEKVVSFGRSCGTFESLEARRSAGSSGYLLPPPP